MPLFLSSVARLSQPIWDPRLCVPRLLGVCRYRKGTFYSTDIMRDSCQQVIEGAFGDLVIVPSVFNELEDHCREPQTDWPV